MGNQSIYHLKPEGNKIQRAIINTLNFLTDIVTETIVKPNTDRLDKNINTTVKLETKGIDTFEQLVDTEFELEQVKDEIVDQMEAQIDIEFRVAQLEDEREV